MESQARHSTVWLTMPTCQWLLYLETNLSLRAISWPLCTSESGFHRLTKVSATVSKFSHQLDYFSSLTVGGKPLIGDGKPVCLDRNTSAPVSGE